MVGRGLPARAIISVSRIDAIMEAEQLNLIANNLADLQQRTADLRRYL